MVFLKSAFGWLLSPTGSLVAGVLVLFGAWQIDRVGQRSKGASEALVRVEKQTKALNAKAQDARRSAERQPNEALRQWYRD